MKKYNVIQIDTQNIVYSDDDYNSCIDWIESYGDLLNFTIIGN